MIERIIAEIDAEIARLTEVRKLLANVGTQSVPTKLGTKKRKRKMSAAARARIADAQRQRWAKQKAQK
jgi:hypothetical protein